MDFEEFKNLFRTNRIENDQIIDALENPEVV